MENPFKRKTSTLETSAADKRIDANTARQAKSETHIVQDISGETAYGMVSNPFADFSHMSEAAAKIIYDNAKTYAKTHNLPFED
jgi:hypothetical protein